jgi:predicted transport protein
VPGGLADLLTATAHATIRLTRPVTLCGMGQTPDDMMSAVSASLADRTGRSLGEWVTLVHAAGIDPLDQNAVRKWLRSAHGVPQNSQWAIADATARAAGWVRPSVAEYVQRQYSGAKAGLRPIYDALAAAVSDLGDDVTIEGRSTYTPFVRGRQFAAVAPATRDRVDLGLRFTEPPHAGRLQPATAPGQATHKVSLGSVHDLDDEVLHLLRIAYEQNA